MKLYDLFIQTDHTAAMSAVTDRFNLSLAHVNYSARKWELNSRNCNY